MGVSGLQTFMEETTPSSGENAYFYQVDIAQLCRNHPNPIIIVDVMSCMRKLYVDIGNLELICGGQHREYLEIWSWFIQR